MKYLAVVLVALATACGPTLADIQKDSKTTGDKLSDCRTEARAAFFIDGKTEKESLDVYIACKKRSGL